MSARLANIRTILNRPITISNQQTASLEGFFRPFHAHLHLNRSNRGFLALISIEIDKEPIL